MKARPPIFGIVNLTADSFSDGGLYLDPAAAIEHSLRLLDEGAAVIDLGPSASNIAAAAVGADEEIRRLEPVVAALEARGAAISVDSFRPETQRWAIARGVAFLNDIKGFENPALYPLLARSKARLIVMHALLERDRAGQADVAEGEVWRSIEGLFDARTRALEEAGIARERLILDPGMGYFLGRRGEASLSVLANLDRLKGRYGLPVLVSVSRKSFLRALTAQSPPSRLAAATLAAELYAASKGADFIRTHDPAALSDAFKVMEALEAAEASG